MKKKQTSFEQFLKTYMNNSKISGEKGGYADWLRKNGINADGIYESESLKSKADKEAALSGYGTTAERLANDSLENSGYAKFLDAQSKKKFSKSETEAIGERFENAEKNMRGHKEQKEKEEAKTTELMSSVVKKLSSASMLDYERSYSYALKSGLSESDAKSAAETSYEIVRQKIKDSIIITIANKNFAEEQTRKYAQARGLGEEDVKELCEFSKRLNEYVN